MLRRGVEKKKGVGIQGSEKEIEVEWNNLELVEGF